MPQRFQFSLRALLTVMTLAAVATWLSMLGGFAVVVGLPVVVAALWGISRRDGVFLSLLVVAISVIALLAAGMRDD